MLYRRRSSQYHMQLVAIVELNIHAQSYKDIKTRKPVQMSCVRRPRTVERIMD